MELYLATNRGFVAAKGSENNWQVARRGLEGQDITSLIAREGVILAGTTDGIFASEDRGATWTEKSHGLIHRHVRWLAFHPDFSDFELAGTEPAAICVSRDGGESWHSCPEVETLRDQFGWWLPYSSGAGCVRGFAVNGNRLYAAVEVGGLLCTDDFGRTWRLVEGSHGRPEFGHPPAHDIHPDVHSVECHPSLPHLLFAATGGGFYVSADGGATWVCRYDCYVRAVWSDPTDARHLILGPSTGPDGRHGRIEQSHDSGQTWTPLTEPQPYNMVERFYQSDQMLFAVMAEGQLWAADLQRLIWQPLLPELSGINAVTMMIG